MRVYSCKHFITGGVLILFSLLGTLSAQAGLNKVSVAQLEKLINANVGKSDSSLADKLYDVDLTERLSDARLKSAEAMLPGEESREALTAIADVAVFLPLPKADRLTDAAPDADTAAAIFKCGQDYAAKLIPTLPNFFATRVITRYVDKPLERPRNQTENLIYEPLHVAGNSTVTVLYRGGHEVIDAGSANKAGNDKDTKNLNTEGEFGPMLLTVLADSRQGVVKWDHWEEIAGTKAAVFNYAVPQQFSHYTLNEPWIDHNTSVLPAYHGEIAINPVDGTVLRLTMIADIGPKDLVVKANLSVDYGEVEIGAKKFICPVKSVALTLVHVQHGGEIDSVGIGWEHEKWSTLGPAQTFVNDMRFSEYHQFRSETVIVGADLTPK